MPEKREVTRHAVGRLRRRRPLLFPLELDDWQVRAFIRREVEEALDAGRVSERKTVGFRLHGQSKARPLPEGQRLVWNAAGELGWIVALDGAVITSLTRTGPAA